MLHMSDGAVGELAVNMGDAANSCFTPLARPMATIRKRYCAHHRDHRVDRSAAARMNMASATLYASNGRVSLFTLPSMLGEYCRRPAIYGSARTMCVMAILASTKLHADSRMRGDGVVKARRAYAYRSSPCSCSAHTAIFQSLQHCTARRIS